VETPVPAVSPVKQSMANVTPSHHVQEEEVFTEIATFGWEDEGYGKHKVMVYIMSNIDGVGALPRNQVTCDFTPSSFDLKIKQLNGKNYRLIRHNLEKEVNPQKCSFKVKKNRVVIALWKADEKNTWMNLTAKNPAVAAKSKNSSDPTAGIMDMMKVCAYFVLSVEFLMLISFYSEYVR